jgi:alkanesulfonate monooxygenase SsuD/methylene tetrahydromethanopterin reductase-like flavin-dependent oxidoreductase (luciferase family)
MPSEQEQAAKLKLNVFDIVNGRDAAGSPAAYNERIMHLVEEIKLADKLGFERYWVAEHHLQHESWENCPNPLKVFDHVAPQTERIRFGTAITVLPWWNPIRLAEDVALTDHLTGGRVDFGVGRGYNAREHLAFGTSREEETNREVFDEMIEIMKAAWSNPTFSFQGKHFSIPSTENWVDGDERYFTAELARDRMLTDPETNDILTGKTPIPEGTPRTLALVPRPLQQPHPPLWQGCFTPRSIKYAASHGLRGLFVQAELERMTEMVELYIATAKEAGWTPGPEDMVCGVPVHIGETDAAARAEFEPTMLNHGYMFGALGFLATAARPGEKELLPEEATFEYLTERVWLVGSADTVAERASNFMEALAPLGVSQFFVATYSPSHEHRVQTLEGVAETVRPALERVVAAHAGDKVSAAE